MNHLSKTDSLDSEKDSLLRNTRREQLLLLQNATSSMVAEIIGMRFQRFFHQLRDGRDYSENPKPKKDGSREVTFTREGVNRLLDLVDKVKIREVLNGGVQVSLPSIEIANTLDKLQRIHGFKKYSWQRAVQQKPMWFGGGIGTKYPPYVRTLYLKEALDLIGTYEKSPTYTIVERITIPKIRSYKKI